MSTGARPTPAAGLSRWPAYWLVIVVSLTLVACWPQETAAIPETVPATPSTRLFELRLITAGSEKTIVSSARTVGEALAEAGVTIGPADDVSPPAWTPLNGPPPVTEITLVRVTQSEAISAAAVPFQREIVRSAQLSPSDDPIIVQHGQDGVQEVVYRITYRDGLEHDRWVSNVRVIEPPVNEILLVGVGAEQREQPVDGTLAYVSDGRPVVVRGSTERAFSLETAGALDGRVFQLSPDGRFLLFSRADSDAAFDNSLWIVASEPDANPVPLNIDNVLWAAWDPASAPELRLAYSTARALPNPPGWEANNDVWLLTLDALPDTTTAPIRLADALPAAYGWWGGSYSWSPDGRYLAYAFADQVGLLPIPQEAADEGSALVDLLAGLTVEPQPLHTFEPYDTGGEWAWTPSVAWSPDGSRIAFSQHHRDERGDSRFDLVTLELAEIAITTVAPQAGIWSHASWPPVGPTEEEKLYFTQATEPDPGLGSDYTLWELEPAAGVPLQRFPDQGQAGTLLPVAQWLAWEPGGTRAAVIFDEALHILDMTTGNAFRRPQDDALDSHPTWAPYGPGAAGP